MYGDENGKTIQIEEVFKVGEQTLQLQAINVDDFSLGGIAKMEMLVENKWGEEIKEAYINTEVYKDGELMSKFKSATQDIPALSKGELISYWDTAGVQKGTYDTEVNIKYGQESIKENIKLDVQENEINVLGLGYVISEQGGGTGDNNLVTILIILVIILVIVNIYFLFIRKKLLGKN
jgi:hypothetical protein